MQDNKVPVEYKLMSSFAYSKNQFETSDVSPFQVSNKAAGSRKKIIIFPVINIFNNFFSQCNGVEKTKL